MRCKLGLFSRPPFTPDLLSGLTGWYDAADASTLYDGGSLVAVDGGVGRWEDKSGNANHIGNTNELGRPTRKSAVQNGLDVLRFDGTNDQLLGLELTLSSFFSSTQGSFFCVAKVALPSTNNSTPGDNPAVFLRPDGLQGFFAFRSNGTVESYGSENSFTYKTVSQSFTADEWTVYTAVHSSGALGQRINGGTEATVSLGTRSDMDGQVRFARTAFSESKYLNCDIAEMIAYNVGLADADREAVESYLMNKWAIT